MSVVSTASSFKAALVKAVKADTVLVAQNVQVTYGFLPRDYEEETIAIAGITWPDEVWAATGNQRRDERYAISVWVFANKAGQRTQQEATERAFELLGRIETVLRSNPRLNGSHWCELVPQRLAEQPGDDGYQAAAEARVAVFARK